MYKTHITKDYTTEKGVPIVLHENRFFKMMFNGYFHYLDGVKYGKGITTIPYFENGDLLLVRLIRAPNIGYSFEFPRGGVEPNEEYKDAATRELLEETGYQAYKENIVHIGNIAPDSATINGVPPVYMIKLKDTTPVAKFDEDEIESVIRVSEKTFKQMCLDKTIICGQTLASYTLYKLNQDKS